MNDKIGSQLTSRGKMNSRQFNTNETNNDNKLGIKLSQRMSTLGVNLDKPKARAHSVSKLTKLTSRETNLIETPLPSRDRLLKVSFSYEVNRNWAINIYYK